jgi:hypothetical protein
VPKGWHTQTALRRWFPEEYSTLRAAGKPQRQAEIPAHCGVCSKAGHKIHWRIQARPHHEMRTQNRPARSILTGPLCNNVLLLVVVDRRNETWLCLLRWSVERPKTEAVRLGTTGKHDALKRHIARGESVERIFQHSEKLLFYDF